MMTLDEQYKLVQHKILQVGLVLPGTIRKVYLRCGKENCRCMNGAEEDRHGPYFFWDRKIKGRLSSFSIKEEDLPYYKKGIASRRKLEQIIAEIFETGAQIAVQFKKIKKLNRGKVHLQPAESKFVR